MLHTIPRLPSYFLRLHSTLYTIYTMLYPVNTEAIKKRVKMTEKPADTRQDVYIYIVKNALTQKITNVIIGEVSHLAGGDTLKGAINIHKALTNEVRFLQSRCRNVPSRRDNVTAASPVCVPTSIITPANITSDVSYNVPGLLLPRPTCSQTSFYFFRFPQLPSLIVVFQNLTLPPCLGSVRYTYQQYFIHKVY